MTTAREVVHNRALSGEELKTIILADFQKLLDNEGFLSAYIAYGRVAYDLTMVIHTDNPLSPRSESHVASKPRAWNEIEKHPQLAAVETLPLVASSPDSSLGATTLHRTIDSPNAERLRNGMPIPVMREQQDGTKTMEMVKYPPQDAEVGEGDVTISDVTRQTAQALGIPQEPVPLSPTAPVVDHQSIMCKCGRSRGQHALSGIGTPMEGFPACNGFTPATAEDKGKEAWPVVPS